MRCLFFFVLLLAAASNARASESTLILEVKPGFKTLELALEERRKHDGPALIKLTRGEYPFQNSLSLPPGTRLVGAGKKTVLRAIPPAKDKPCGLRVSSDCELRKFSLIYRHAEIRQQSSATAMIYVYDARNVVIRDVTVQGSASAGILLEAAGSVEIADCTVSDTLADGIHITNGSTDVVVHRCYVHHTGDDGIATVSYRVKAAQSRRITIKNNRVEHCVGRALTCIGSKDVIIADNRARDCIGGIYVAFEGFYNTYAPENVTVERNIISDCGKRVGLQGLHLGSARNVRFVDNRFFGCLPGYVSNTGAGPNRLLVFENNRFENTIDNGHSALEFLDTVGLQLSDNRFTRGRRPPLYFGPDVRDVIQTGTILFDPSVPQRPHRSHHRPFPVRPINKKSALSTQIHPCG